MENPHGRWFGSLELRFDAVGRETVLARQRHVGPLRVQRPFLERDGACQVYVLNPPGGSVGGDELRLVAHLSRGSRALLTAPGASKFYRSAGPKARSRQHFEILPGARLEWLPQETIVYDGAVAESHTRIDLHRGGQYAGWDVTCLGRPAAGESFAHGSWSQRTALFEDGAPLWLDRSSFEGSDVALQAAWGLGGRPVYGSFVVHPVTEAALSVAREVARASVQQDWFAATLLEQGAGLGTEDRCSLVVRYVGTSTTRARHLFTRVWQELRPLYFGSSAELPRIWAT